MRLILSRKGFDSASGGCANPLFPDGSMIALPVPDKSAPVSFQELTWRRRNLGDIVEVLTKGRQRRKFRAHLDPDLRPELRPRPPGWRPVFGQRKAALGHLHKQGVCRGDLFLFWGLFRPVDEALRWQGPPVHVVWGWLHVGDAVVIDAELKDGRNERWRWAAGHPHLHYEEDPGALYAASDGIRYIGALPTVVPASGVFDFFDRSRQLTAPGSSVPSRWRLPRSFLPRGRKPLTYHSSSGRWAAFREHALLDVVPRGQEFVLDLGEYPEVAHWAAAIIGGSARAG